MSAEGNKETHRTKRALVLGNGKYSLERNRLNQTKNNWHDMKKALQEMGFEVKTRSDLSRTDMIDTFRTFADSVHDGDLVLLYYFGHACHVNGKNVLVPIDDSQIGKNEDLVEAGCAIGVGRQVDLLKKSTPSYVLICALDCCRPYFLPEAKSK